MENFDYDLRSIQEARDLARRGEAAAKKMAGYTSGQIDMILQNMVRTAEAHGACLARMAVEETGFGKVLDKTYKNHAASTLLYNDIKDMKTIPDAIFVVDPKKERICVQEAHTLGIPLIGIIDTNCDPEELDYVIPGNDDAIRAVKLIVSRMADAVIEARQGEAEAPVFEGEDVAEEAAQA